MGMCDECIYIYLFLYNSKYYGELDQLVERPFDIQKVTG